MNTIGSTHGILGASTRRAPRLAALVALSAMASLRPVHAASLQDAGHYAETDSRYEILAGTLRRSVLWLAHDERQGRRAGTQGELDTVLWDRQAVARPADPARG